MAEAPRAEESSNMSEENFVAGTDKIPLAGDQTPRVCAKCSKPAESNATGNLKQCAKCHITLHCSRDCLKADWKGHKKICARQNQEKQDQKKQEQDELNRRRGEGAEDEWEDIPDGPSPSVGSSFSSAPFEGRTDLFNTYFRNRPDAELFTLLIDIYRLRVEDEYCFRGDASGLYSGEGPIEAFREFKRFLNRFHKKCKRMHPPLWSEKKRKECERFAFARLDSGEWGDLGCCVEKSDIQEHYTPGTPMQFRMLGEKITGESLMGF